jgi:hypothetical protein
MTKSAALKKLEVVMGKLDHLNWHIEGNKLGDAMREVAHVRDGLQNNQLTVRKITKVKKLTA